MGKKRRTTVPSTASESEDVFDSPLDLNDHDMKIINFFKGRLKLMSEKFENKLAEKDCILEQLTSEVSNLKKKIMLMDDRVEDADAYERRDTIIVSGKDLLSATDKEDTTQIVSSLLRDKVGYFLRNNEVSVAHRLGPKPKTQAPDQRNIIVKLCRREIKHDILKACRTVKPSNMYVNESLTRTRSATLYGLRQAKMKYPNIIAGCGSSDGKVYAWIKPPNPSTPNAKNLKTLINTRERFSDFCEKTLKCNSTDFITDWPNL